MPIHSHHLVRPFAQQVVDLLRLAVEPICGFGLLATDALALGVGPMVFRAADDHQSPWRDECQQFVLVKGQPLFTVTILPEIAAKPMMTPFVDTL